MSLRRLPVGHQAVTQNMNIMHWLDNPYIDLAFVAGQLYGGRSRLHTRRLQDKLKGRSPFQQWERERLAQLKEQLVANLVQEKGIYAMT